MTEPNVSIVIPTMGRSGYLKDLVISLRNTAPSSAIEIIIVSSDPEESEKVQWMRAQPDIRLIMSDSFSGPAKKRKRSLYYYTNLGIYQAKKEWVLVVNDDMVFEKDWYSHFANTASDAKNENAGMIIVSSHVGDISLGARIVKIGSTKKQENEWKDLYLADVSFIRRDVLKMINFFDEKQDWFGAGLDNALAVEFLTNQATIIDDKIKITHFIAEENRVSRRGNAFYDFMYLKIKWDKWCKNHDCQYICDLGVNPNNLINSLRYQLHTWLRNRNK